MCHENVNSIKFICSFARALQQICPPSPSRRNCLLIKFIFVFIFMADYARFAIAVDILKIIFFPLHWQCFRSIIQETNMTIRRKLISATTILRVVRFKLLFIFFSTFSSLFPTVLLGEVVVRNFEAFPMLSSRLSS